MSAFNINEIPGLQELWAETLGDPNVCIAILDGPVDQSHPSLAAANLTQIKTLASGAPNHGPASQHGTHIASIIFGQHDGPVRGIAPQCRGVIVPIFKDGADGSIAPCSQVDLARAISQSIRC
jgi:subtilisin family serine protease